MVLYRSVGNFDYTAGGGESYTYGTGIGAMTPDQGGYGNYDNSGE
jgi:hypothetical protein